MNVSGAKLQVNCTLLDEGKAFGGRRTFADDKSIMMDTMVRIVGSLKGNLDRKLIRDSRSGYKDLKGEFHDNLFGIFSSYKSGDITIAELEKQWRAEIKGAWEKAYQFGTGSVGNPFGATRLWDEDKTWLKGAEGEEYGYLGKFIRDIKNDTLKMDAEKRLEMYAQTLDGIYHHGQVEGSPDYVEIIWNLSDAKHCSSCIKLAAGSPYTKKGGKNPLPSTPRDGSSECLSFCQCFLTFRYLDKPPTPEPEPEVRIIGPGGIDIPKGIKVPEDMRLPTHDEYDHLSQISTEIDQLRGFIDASTGTQKKEFIAARRDLNKDLHDYAKERGIYYVPKSNYIQGEKPMIPRLPKSVKSDRPTPPKGYREPTETERERVDDLAREVDMLRILIATSAASERKVLIAKRYKVNQAMISYMEKKKIYYLPYMELGIEAEDLVGVA